MESEILYKVAGLLAEEIDDFARTHMTTQSKVRIDDLGVSMARLVANELNDLAESRGETKYAHVLVRNTDGPDDIDRYFAVGLRNHTKDKLLILVGDEDAQGSLDNPFYKLPLGQVLNAASSKAWIELCADPEIETQLEHIRSAIKPRPDSFEWFSFLVSISPDLGSPIGENLWRVGLVPDLGDDLASRISSNYRATREISRPSAPGSNVQTRLVKAGIADGVARSRLAKILAELPLYDVQSWALELLVNYRNELTFEHWPRTEQVFSDMSEIRIDSFTDAKGDPTKASKLILGSSGELLLPLEIKHDRVAQDSSFHGVIGVKWSTTPVRVSSVATWRIELLPPRIVRESVVNSTPSAVLILPAARRTAQFSIDLDSTSVDAGAVFVVSVSAIDHDGNVLLLHSEQGATATGAVCESEEFSVEVLDISSSGVKKEATARSIAESRVQVALEGRDPAGELEKVMRDDASGIASVYSKPRELARIPYSPTLLDAELNSISNLDKGMSYSAHFNPDGFPALGSVNAEEISLPQDFLASRRKFFSAVANSGGHGLSLAFWDESLVKLATNYGQSFIKALEAVTDEGLHSLMTLDVVSVHEANSTKEPIAAILLATHPLKALWHAEYNQRMSEWAAALFANERPKEVFNLNLLDQVTSARYPFAISGQKGEIFAFHSEPFMGTSLYSKPEMLDSPELNHILNYLQNGATRERGLGKKLAEKLTDYRALHSGIRGLEIVSINPGEGQLVANGLRAAFPETLDRERPVEDFYPIRIHAFSDEVQFAKPVPELVRLQEDYREVTFSRQVTWLAPPLSVSTQPLEHFMTSDAIGHVGLIENASKAHGVARIPSRSISSQVGGLVNGIHVSGYDRERGTFSVESASGDLTPKKNSLQYAHGAYLDAVSKLSGAEPGQHPGLEVGISSAGLEILREVYERNDWVVLKDRFLGLGLLEVLLQPLVRDATLIDYSPDYGEANVGRLTLSTSHRTEIERVVMVAMRELGLENLNRTAKDVLSTLASVSGRLAMRLLKVNTLAREAVGIAALITHLDAGDKLKNAIVIPVDAHPEIFHPSKRAGDQESRRCDLIVLRLGKNGFAIELIEVKARASAERADPELNKIIASQLVSTRKLIEGTLLANASTRIDWPLQRASFAAMVHFYAAKAIALGRFETKDAAAVHRDIDRLIQISDKTTFELTGYIVSLDTGPVPEQIIRDGARIKHLRAADLEQLGFTTVH